MRLLHSMPLAALFLLLASSSSVLADTEEPTSVPPIPTLLVSKNVGTGEVVLSWSSTTGPYAAVRDTDSNPNNYTSTIVAGVGGVTFADPVLTDGVNYFYVIEDENAPTRVYSVSSNAGVAGQSVTVSGIGFAGVLADNTVSIAGIPALVTGATSTTLTYTIPTQWVSGEVIVGTPKGVNIAGQLYVVGTDSLPAISSVAVDSIGTKFVATTGTDASLSDRVFTFDPSTGNRTQVGALGESTGLPTDASGSPTNRVYYGNATTGNFNNAGTIERTRSSGGEALYRACGVAVSDPCYVFGLGLDPDLTDFGTDGRVYVADGCTFSGGACSSTDQEVLIVPPTGGIQVFADGFNFGASPRGIVVDRTPPSFYHDVYISDSTSVSRYNSSTVPGTLAQKYEAPTYPLVSPRQLALTPPPRERLLIADSGLGRLVMINPATNALKVLNPPLTSPRAVAIEHDFGTNVSVAWVGEPTRVLKVPVYKTVYLKVWIATGAGISVENVREFLNHANASLAQCGVEAQLRDNRVTYFDAGALLDLAVFDVGITAGCGDSNFHRTQDEIDLLAAPRRSSVSTDLNVYFVKRFRHGAVTATRIGETITEDCFVGMNDASESGVIISTGALQKNTASEPVGGRTIWTLGHEIAHALLDRNTWTGASPPDEHKKRSGAALPALNLMRPDASEFQGLLNEADQCLNINDDITIFRADP